MGNSTSTSKLTLTEDIRFSHQVTYETKQNNSQKTREIIETYNSLYIPSFMFGKINTKLKSKIKAKRVKFIFTSDIVSNINKTNITDLKNICNKVQQNIEWINKYVIGNENTKPLVDYVFDFKDIFQEYIYHFLQKQIKEFSKKQTNSSKSTKSSLSSIGILHNSNLCNLMQKIYDEYTICIKNITQSREYYYGNYVEFINTFDSMNLNILTNKKDIYPNIDDFHILNSYNKEKINKLSFLNDFKVLIPNVAYYCGENEMNTYYSAYLFDSHIENLLFKKTLHQFTNNINIVSNDFKDLLYFAKIFLNLIYELRPELTM